MGSEGSGDRVSQQRGGGTNSVSGVTMCSESMLYGSNWDPIMSLSGNFGNSNMVSTEFANPLMLENQTRVSPLAQFQSDSVLDLVPRIPTFGSSSFSEMIPSFGQKSGAYEDHCRNPENGILMSSPYGKRKREEASKGASPNKNGEEEQQKDPSADTSEFPKEDDEKKQKNSGRGKQVAKQEKDNSGGAEMSKDNYIHVRARRGQATNSHSLAERVRRERISERMKLLQELVPGCNKITGKAMMLDEIINYVQSLQQQVEFLSMKLATVNPEINMDIDRILSKDILQLQSNATLHGINRPSLPFPGFPQGSFTNGPSTTTPLHSLPQHIWNNELQNLLQMGFDSDPSVSMGPNGP